MNYNIDKCFVCFSDSLFGVSSIFLIISGITTGLSWIFYFKALQIGEVSKVAVIDKLSIALTIILAFIFLKETITLKTIIGIIFIIAGTLIVSL